MRHAIIKLGLWPFISWADSAWFKRNFRERRRPVRTVTFACCGALFCRLSADIQSVDIENCIRVICVVYMGVRILNSSTEIEWGKGAAQQVAGLILSVLIFPRQPSPWKSSWAFLLYLPPPLPSSCLFWRRFFWQLPYANYLFFLHFRFLFVYSKLRDCSGKCEESLTFAVALFHKCRILFNFWMLHVLFANQIIQGADIRFEFRFSNMHILLVVNSRQIL